MVSTSYNKHQQSSSEQTHQLLNSHPITSLQVRNSVVCSKAHDLTTSLLQGKILPMLTGEGAGWGQQLVSLLVTEYLPLLGNVCVKLHKHFERNFKFLFSQKCLNYLTVRSCVGGQNTEISVTGALKYDSNVCAAQQYSAQTKVHYYYNSYTRNLA